MSNTVLKENLLPSFKPRSESACRHFHLKSLTLRAMKKVVVFLMLILCSNSLWAQKKLLKKLFSNEKDTTRKASFMPVPVFGYAQETGFQFGLGALYSFYIAKKDTTNRSSNFSGNASYSTKKTYNLSLKGDAWTKKNTYHFIGDIKLRRMPFNFYGVGNNTLAANADELTQQQARILFDAERAFVKNFYTGLSLGFEQYQLTDKVGGGIYTTSQNLPHKTGSTLLLVGVSQSYDTRNSNNYPTKGFFGRISYQYLASNFKAHLIKLNVRNFWPIAPKVVLGVNGIYQTIQGNSIPFYNLPQLGSDEMMRGYYAGRYRDQNLLAAQAELRYRFMNKFGVVAFAGGGKVFNHGNFTVNDLKPNYGLGGRYFFDTAKGLSVRVDYGIGEKKANEKRQSGMYISLAEAF